MNIYQKQLIVPLIYLSVILLGLGISMLGSMIGSAIVPDPSQVAISP